MSLLKVSGLAKTYRVGSWLSSHKMVRAVRSVDFDIRAGETVAIVGESGCGKSTLARLLMRIEEPDAGHLTLLGKDSKDWGVRDWQSKVQMIFQDPLSSLNPRKAVKDLIAEPMVIAKELSSKDIYDRVRDLMGKVGLRPEWVERYPHMLSGGQRQRVGIARALSLNPQLLICDEPVSALDVSLQAQVLNLLLQLQDTLGLSYIFISHDLSVVRHISHRIAVMYLGRMVEQGSREDLIRQPGHPYTQALLKSFPTLGQVSPAAQVLTGELPSPTQDVEGCAFASRCPQVMPICRKVAPRTIAWNSGSAECHLLDKSAPSFEEACV